MLVGLSGLFLNSRDLYLGRRGGFFFFGGGGGLPKMTNMEFHFKDRPIHGQVKVNPYTIGKKMPWT